MASETMRLGMGAAVAAAIGVGVVVAFPPATAVLVAPEPEPASDVVVVEPVVVEPAPEVVAPTLEVVEAIPEIIAPTPEVVENTPDVVEQTPLVEEPDVEIAEVEDIAPVVQDPIDSTPEAEPVEPVQDAAVIIPTLDELRIEPDGLAVIVGRAAPDVDVDVLVIKDIVDSPVTDGSGAFASVVFLEPSSESRTVTLIADPDGDAVKSTKIYLIEPFGIVDETPKPDTSTQETIIGAVSAAPILQDSEVGNEVASIMAEQLAIADPEPTLEETVSIEPVRVAPAAPRILVADEAGVRVVNDRPPEATTQIALDTITYDPQGEVSLAGRASQDGFVQVYINNRQITASRVTEGGDWRSDLPDVDTGIYTLRIDEVDAEGTVLSRIETPFKREEPADVAAVMAEETQVEGFESAVKTVQPGSTLWAIAREQFGEGIMYVAVYEANRDLIRDPDLIYPGQVFRMPTIGE